MWLMGGSVVLWTTGWKRFCWTAKLKYINAFSGQQYKTSSISIVQDKIAIQKFLMNLVFLMSGSEIS
jgi:hypothetical protein